jgi:hypothetical protein
MTLKNPITNGKIVGTVERDAYLGSQHPRGHLEFAMSRGELMEFNRCPHRWLMGYQSDETKAQEWGSLIDCLVLTPERFDSEFAITPDEYPGTPKRKSDPVEMKPWNKNADYCKEWAAEREGLAIIKPDLHAEATAAVKTLLADEQIAVLVECSRKQVMVVGQYIDQETGLTVPLKGLIDLEPDKESRFKDSLADLKTCNSASPFPWTRAVFEHGYHVQAALYLDLHNAATGEERTTFLHVLQESYAPWEVGKRLLSQEFIELGRLTYVSALRRYCACLAANSWPGYDTEGKMIINGWNLTEPEAWMIGKEI